MASMVLPELSPEPEPESALTRMTGALMGAIGVWSAAGDRDSLGDVRGDLPAIDPDEHDSITVDYNGRSSCIHNISEMTPQKLRSRFSAEITLSQLYSLAPGVSSVIVITAE
jgi:hypothetical protein